MKTKEELNTMKKEFEAINQKVGELTDENSVQASGGVRTSKRPVYGSCPFCSAHIKLIGTDPCGEYQLWNCPNCGQIRYALVTGTWIDC